MNNNELVVKKLLQKSALLSIRKELIKAKIKFLVIKGFSLSCVIYENPNERDFDDIDIYIDRSDLEKTISIFNALGFTNIRQWVPQTISKQIPFQKSYHSYRVDVDLHFELTIFPYINALFSFKRCYEESALFYIDSHSYRTFNLEDTYLYLRYHLLLELKRGNTNTAKWEKDIDKIKEKLSDNASKTHEKKWLLSEDTQISQLDNDAFLYNLMKPSRSKFHFHLFRFTHCQSKIKFMLETIFPKVGELEYTGKYKTRLHRILNINKYR